MVLSWHQTGGIAEAVAMKTFGQALRDLRREKGMSQRELAKQIDVDFSYVSKIENGRLRPPAADRIVRICDVLGVQPDTLLALSGKVPSDLTNMIGSNRAALEFVRSAQILGLSDREWAELTRQLKKLRE